MFERRQEVKPSRGAEAPIALECQVTQIVPVIDTTLLKPLARLSGDVYATLGRVFEMKHPPA